MAPIVSSVEIARKPEDVFGYMTDIDRQTEWQESLVSVQTVDNGPQAAGQKVRMTRRVGGRNQTMTSEVTEWNPPRSFAFRGVDGPVRANGKGRVEPVGDGSRSRVTFELDFEGHGIGKVLVPLVVRRQAQKQLPKNHQNLKQRLEGAV